MSQGTLNQLGKNSFTDKDVFKKKGGTFALFILAALVLLVVFNIKAIMEFADNLFHTILLFAGSAIILYVLFDKNTRLMASTAYMLFIQKLISAFVKIDPISILKDTIQQMKRKITFMEDNMGKLNGVCLSLDEKIKTKKSELQNCIDRLKAAKNRNNENLATIEGRQASRIEQLTKDYIELHESSKKWYKTMSKIAEMAKLTVLDAENEVNAQEEKYNLVKLAHKSFKSAMSVIKGDPDDLALYNQAFQFVHDDIMAKLGEMDRVINTSGGLIDQIDVENDVYKIKGSDLLKKYEDMGVEAMFSTFEKSATEGLQYGTNTQQSGVSGMHVQAQPQSTKKYF